MTVPTVAEYVRAAALFEDAGSHAQTLLAPVRSVLGPDVLSGGGLSRSTESTIEERTNDGLSLAAELVRLANDCRYRAAVVATAAAEAAAYDQAIRRHDAQATNYDHLLALHESDSSRLHPGQRPHPPAMPPEPPAWADF